MTEISRPRFPFDIVGFDLDGTLLDTTADLAAAVNHALASAGRATLTIDQVRPMVGGGGRHMLAQGMAATGGCTDDELDALLQRLLAYYEEHIADLTRPFPGALAALDRLAEVGVKLAIVTNKRERLARLVLGQLRLTGRFATIIGGDRLGDGRGKPARDLIDLMIEECGGGRAAFVGDTVYDVEAARNAGISVVTFNPGFPDMPTGDLGADAVIDHYDALIPTLERLG
ncbi:phosphoglycolate phosphatase [Sphingomonas jinjuensis]|uniref:phosphoglycolate phosphatase n=1 Tax=Sphingomonas jinjuensis TaxID=535907 RepID=A0A840F924_9SPHN|nr:HAD-IA family hydrolase [Sphingomonas jinjuensis]MBB4152796.1 phosphoglycolate phosphatase [Sphingomonas jinjuensis]